MLGMLDMHRASQTTDRGGMEHGGMGGRKALSASAFRPTISSWWCTSRAVMAWCTVQPASQPTRPGQGVAWCGVLTATEAASRKAPGAWSGSMALR